MTAAVGGKVSSGLWGRSSQPDGAILPVQEGGTCLLAGCHLGPTGKPVEPAKYQPVEKEVVLRGHLCVAAGDVGKRQNHKSLERDARFPVQGQALQMFI